MKNIVIQPFDDLLPVVDWGEYQEEKRNCVLYVFIKRSD